MLEDLATELDQAEPFDDAARKRLEGIWQRIVAGKYSLSRHTLTDLLNSQTVVARADMIEDIPQRAIPRTATVYVDVAVNDRDYFSSARSSATMSLILMIGVLAFLICWPIVNPKASAPTPEVLAIVLTLFATVQADRIERPDRSTLRGRLFALGNWLIAASSASRDNPCGRAGFSDARAGRGPLGGRVCRCSGGIPGFHAGRSSDV